MKTRQSGIAWLLAVLPLSTAWGYTHEELFRQTIPADGVATLNVQNVNGDISVRPWDRAEVYVEAKKRIGGTDRQTAEENARKVEIAVERKADAIEIRTLLPGHQHERDWIEAFFSLDWLFEMDASEAKVTYAISVPARMDTDLNTINGGITLGALEGRAHLRTVNGSLDAAGYKGELDGRVINGGIVLSRFEGGGDLETTNGEVEVEFLALGGPGCQARTTNGNVRVVLPDSVRADLDAATTTGKVASDLPLVVAGDLGRQNMIGKINGGGLPLKLRTTNGNIRIARAGQ
jgi:DUF4097 and DUF4098 domain-containing protein YvlB